MKRLVLLLVNVLFVISIAQAQKGKISTIVGYFDNPIAECNQPVKLFIWTGAMPEEIGTAMPTATADGKGTFAFNVSEVIPGFYFIGYDPMQVRAFVMNREEMFVLRGNAQAITQIRVENSNDNREFEVLMQRQQAISASFGQMIQQYVNSAALTPEQKTALEAKMKALDETKVNLLDSLQKANPLLHKIATLSTYLSFQRNKQRPNQSEGEYFAENFLKYVDKTDTTSWRLPAFNEAYKNYSTTLANVGLSTPQQLAYLQKELSYYKAPSFNHRAALFSVALARMRNQQNDGYLFCRFYEPILKWACQEYMKYYSNGNAAMKGFAEQQLGAIGSVTEGDMAPEIADKTPDGKILKLSDMKGKYVLIDFWASWCGPCRRANPELKAIYDKYHPKGFEILGVSLDKNLESWKQAIATDVLPWPHVSDLQQWSCAYIKPYAIGSIPSGVLVGPDGKIAAKKIHVQELAAVLQQIYGF